MTHIPQPQRKKSHLDGIRPGSDRRALITLRLTTMTVILSERGPARSLQRGGGESKDPQFVDFPSLMNSASKTSRY
jgi:hypothetical protein